MTSELAYGHRHRELPRELVVLLALGGQARVVEVNVASVVRGASIPNHHAKPGTEVPVPGTDRAPASRGPTAPGDQKQKVTKMTDDRSGTEHPEMGTGDPIVVQSKVAGTPHPETGTVDPPPSTYYADWSPTRSTAVMQHVPRMGTDDATWFPKFRPSFVGGLREWVETLSPGDVVYLETNFEAHDDVRGNAVIDAAEQAGVTLRCLSLRLMQWKGLFERLGLLTHEEDDFNSLLVMAYYVDEGVRHFAAPRRREVRQRGAVDHFNQLRTSGQLDAYVRELTEGRLPPYRELYRTHPEHGDFLGTGDPPKTDRADRLSGYSTTTVVTAFLAAKEAANRKDFDRLMGMFEHGYPNIFRSVFRQRVTALVRRDGLDFKDYKDSLDQDDPRRVSLRKWGTVGRRAMRHLYHLASQDIGHPVKGTTDSDSREGAL